MAEFPIPAGDRWRDLTGGVDVPEHQIMRIKTYLNGVSSDDLVYTKRYGTIVGHLAPNEVVERLVIVGADGTGRRLRRHEFEDKPSDLIDDVASIYLCTCKNAEERDLRYVFVDCEDGDSVLIVCHRDDFEEVFLATKMGGSTGGFWKGGRLVDDEELLSLKEPDFLFSSDMLSFIEENTARFLKGAQASRLIEWGVAPRRGVLLYGAPGNGKTVLTRIAAKRAREAEINVVFLNSRALLRSGEDELRLAASRAPALIIIDDLDIYCGHRKRSDEASTDSERRQRFLADLLEFMDGVVPIDGYVLIATTNARDSLDSALLRAGRFDVHIEVKGPPENDRRELLRRVLETRSSVALPDLSTAATVLEGCSYADISEVGRRYKIAIVTKYGDIVSDQTLLDSVVRSYAQEIKLLETSTSGPSYVED
jgi:ATPase family associated with various cellular activities (AAA)